MPAREKDSGLLALSTYHVDGLDDEGIKALGEWWVGEFHAPHRNLRSSVELPVGEFQKLDLRPDFDNTPPRHVNVVDWPEDEEDQLDIVNELCAVAEENGVMKKYRNDKIDVVVP